MGKTIITVGCIDQRLVIVSAPVLASGGRNEDEMLFEFCSLWDGFTKTAVFYRTEDEVFHAKVTDDKCVIPHEVLTSEGWLYFGVFGVKGDITRTSEVIRYKVTKGALTNGTKPSDPTPDIYAQILAEVGTIENRTAALEACLTQPETYTLTGAVVRLDNYEGMPMECTAQSADGASVTVTRCGKNLCPEWEQGTVSSTTGSNQSSESAIRTVGHIAVVPGETYTLSRIGTANSLAVRGYDAEKNYVGSGAAVIHTLSGGNDTNPLNTSKNVAVIKVLHGCYYLRFADFANDLTNLYQFEVGSTVTDYEPYQGDTYTAPPGEAITIPALAGINTLHSDGDGLTVSGKKDVFSLASYLAKRVKVLEATVATLSAAAVES